MMMNTLLWPIGACSHVANRIIDYNSLQTRKRYNAPIGVFEKQILSTMADTVFLKKQILSTMAHLPLFVWAMMALFFCAS